MTAISVQIDSAKMTEITRALGEIKNGVNKALAGAVNDTTKKGRTRVSTQIREKVAIKKQDIDPHINIKPRATPANPSGRITVQSSRRIALHQFGARQTAKGITYKIEKKGGRKLLPGGFGYPKGKTGFKWVGIRVGKERKPVLFPQGPSAYGVFLKAGIKDSTITIGQQDLYAAMDRRVKFMVGVLDGTIPTKGRIPKVVLG